MITLTVLLIFFGCFVLYNTSKKAILQQQIPLEKWLQANSESSKIIGILLLLLSLLVGIYFLGITSGVLVWLFSLTTLLSLLIIIYPLKKINYKHLCVVFLIAFLIELF